MNTPEKPAFKQANPTNLAGGGEANKYIQSLMKEGITPDERDIYTRQGTTAINNAYDTGTQKLKEMIARNRGATPLGFEASGKSELFGQKSKAIVDLKDKLAMAIRSGKATGVQLYSDMFKNALAQSEGQNQFNIGMYGYDLQNSYGWADLFRDSVSGISKVAAAKIGKG